MVANIKIYPNSFTFIKDFLVFLETCDRMFMRMNRNKNSNYYNGLSELTCCRGTECNLSFGRLEVRRCLVKCQLSLTWTMHHVYCMHTEIQTPRNDRTL